MTDADEELARWLAPLRAGPDRTAILTDFDGTLAPIVADPGAATALPGAVALLHRLSRHYARVAVVSGRPAAFLRAELGLGPDDRLVASGLYGLERIDGGGIVTHPSAERWRDVVEEVAAAADRAAPPGVLVERKGLTLTLHYRTAAGAEDWVHDWVGVQSQRHGLAVHPARMSAELRPPVEVDKGSVVEDLVGDLDRACFLGDDVGDLPAFDALDRLAARGVHAVKVLVASTETAPALRATADVVVSGPLGALAVLHALLPASAGGSGGASAGS